MSITAQSPQAIGLLVGAWPDHWLLLFGDEPPVLAAGTSYLHMAGPVHGFFGLGMARYFASQDAARLLWPLVAAVLRTIIAVGGGWWALRLTGATVDRRCG